MLDELASAERDWSLKLPEQVTNRDLKDRGVREFQTTDVAKLANCTGDHGDVHAYLVPAKCQGDTAQ